MLPFFQAIFDILSRFTFLIGYISGKNSFPKPLSIKEEEEYFRLYKEGDAEAKNILIERNLRLVAHVVKKYQSSGKEQEDLISIGTIGLIKAINTFDPDKGIRLATYACRCIDNEVLMVMRSSKKMQNEVSLQEPIGTDSEGNEISLIDILQGESEEVLDTVALKMQVKKLYENLDKILSKREKLIIELRYGLLKNTAKTQREIAQMMNISRSYVSRIEKKALSKLSRLFADEIAEVKKLE